MLSVLVQLIPRSSAHPLNSHGQQTTNIQAVQPRTRLQSGLHGSFRSVLPVQLPHWHIGLSIRQLSASDGRGCLHGHCSAPHAWPRPVSSKQGNQAAKGGSGCWPPPRYNATLFRTTTTPDPGSTHAMLELIAAGRLELRSRNHPQDIRTRDHKQPARVKQTSPQRRSISSAEKVRRRR